MTKYKPKYYFAARSDKYGAHKVEIDGMRFASKKEARRYLQLKAMAEAGEIRDLKMQVPFTLIPTQFEPPVALNNGRKKRGRCIERECKYIADFAYIRAEDGAYIVEDAKGFRTDVYRIKKKLMLYVYGIRIVEV